MKLSILNAKNYNLNLSLGFTNTNFIFSTELFVKKTKVLRVNLFC